MPDPGTGESALELMGRAMSPPHFPIAPDELGGSWSFDTIDEGTHVLSGFTVRALGIPHKGGRTFAYRVDEGGASFAYLPDHCPASTTEARAAVVDLIRGTDLMIHDAQFRDDEQQIAARYGHSTWSEAIALGVEGAVGEVLLFHHAPGRTDDDLARMLRGTSGAPVPVRLAVEGDEIEWGGSKLGGQADG